MRIVFMGTPEFAVPLLEHLILNRHEILAVYTRSDKPAGRSGTPVVPPVKRVALSKGLTVIQTSLKKPEAVEQLAAFKPEAIVVAAFGQILSQAVLDIPRYGCINIHASLLPKYRGASPIAAAILSGDEFTGVSIMRMEAGLDTGPVYARAQIPISAQDTTGSLAAKLSQIAARLLQEVLVGLARGELTPQPQDEAAATFYGEFTKEDGLIDWHLQAVDIWRRVRAFQPWPEGYTRWQGKVLKVLEVVPLAEEAAFEVGRVVALTPAQKASKAAFGVGTGRGLLGVLRVQLEGKRAMPAEEFLRGQQKFIGSVLS